MQHPMTFSPSAGRTHRARTSLGLFLSLALASTACNSAGDQDASGGGGQNSMATVEEGRDFFREGTLGLDRLISDGLGLDSGLARAEFTTRNALEVGLQLDSARIPAAVLNGLMGDLAGDVGGGVAGALGGGDGSTLDGPSVFTELLERGAVVGLVGVEVDGQAGLDLLGADRLGISCALCHSTVDGSLFDGGAVGAPLPGSVGIRVEGPAPAELRLGALFAYADRSRLLYPYLPQSHQTIGGFPIARTEAFVSENATEDEVDAVLSDAEAFPPGLWDVTPDGIGNPTVIPPVFDIRPAAPYGIAGEFPVLVDALNAHVSLGLDPTFLLTTSGRVLMDRVALSIGAEMANEYEDVVSDAGVMTPAGGFPYLEADATSIAGTLESPVGLRIGQSELQALAVFLESLDEPVKALGNAGARARGEVTYELACAECHGPVGDVNPHGMVSLSDLVIPYAPTTLLARGFPYSDLLDDRLKTYDDRLVIFDRLFSAVQVPAQAREISSPHLTGLHLRSMFLHDGSVGSLDELLDPSRGAGAPHPFYLPSTERLELVEFLTTQ